jgi:hypothetical protein
MSITMERAFEATPEVHDLIVELNDALGATYEAHQRHCALARARVQKRELGAGNVRGRQLRL